VDQADQVVQAEHLDQAEQADQVVWLVEWDITFLLLLQTVTLDPEY
jgi:hypothetical protein